MKIRRVLLAMAACVLSSTGALVLHAAENVPATVTAAVNDPARPQADKDRDAARRPAAMMAASGIKAGDKVIELAPGSGYVTRLVSRIVGPMGKVYAANLPTFNEKMKTGPLQITGNPTYSNVAIIEMPYGELKHGDRGIDDCVAGLFGAKCTSRPSLFEFRVQAFEPDAGVGGGELPVDAHLFAVATLVPGFRLRANLRQRRDAPVQALTRQHAQLGFRDVEPTSMFGCVDQFQLLSDA